MINVSKQLFEFCDFAYKRGWAMAVRDLLPDSTFCDGRSNLWYGRFFVAEDSFANESLFCMGVAHLCPQLDDGDIVIKAGFLGKLEGDGWVLENLRPDGSWAAWSTLYLEWLKSVRSKVLETIAERFPEFSRLFNN